MADIHEQITAFLEEIFMAAGEAAISTPNADIAKKVEQKFSKDKNWDKIPAPELDYLIDVMKIGLVAQCYVDEETGGLPHHAVFSIMEQFPDKDEEYIRGVIHELALDELFAAGGEGEEGDAEGENWWRMWDFGEEGELDFPPFFLDGCCSGGVCTAEDGACCADKAECEEKKKDAEKNRKDDEEEDTPPALV